MPDTEDKKVLDLVRAHDKDSADLIDQLLSTAKLTYPIQDEQQFVNQVGGANAKLTIGGTDVTVGSLMAKAPRYYFPIADEHELISKLADLALQHRSPGPGSAAAGKLLPASAAKPQNQNHPNISDADHKKEKDANPGLHIGGFKRKP
jgi:hypothetical protein